MKGIYRLWLVLLFMGVTIAYSQTVLTGTLTESATGNPLIGATVVVKGTTNGTTTDVNGKYSLSNVQNGATIIFSMIGYNTNEKTYNGSSIDLAMEEGVTELSALEILASRSTQATPFTHTTVDKGQIQSSLGSRDIPMALNIAPSIYATNQGGGAGDARINVRGFDQRNVAIMINGVPVNDMENGWVYWSNWDGLGDAASSIQIQKGLSAVNLATPSIGGTMNIITDPAKQDAGVYFKSETGSWNFKKNTISASSGLINNKFAFNGTLVRKTGDGFYDGTFTDAWAYYVGSSYQATSKDRFEFYVIGAPQRHGQNLYKQNIGRYSHEFASSLDDYDQDAFNSYSEGGWSFNQNYNTVNPYYKGNQAWNMYSSRVENRYNKNYIMERENFFHKPQVNFNYYRNINDKMNWATTAYWSGGKGGGTGTIGSVKTFYGGGNFGIREWDLEIAENAANVDSAYSETLNRSTGILRNSHNDQYTIGAISKLYYEASDNLNLTFGIDWRTAKIDHYRSVRDLLGGDYYVDMGNDFDVTDADRMRGYGDKIAYYNTNTVDWLGAFGSAKYEKNALHAFAMAGYTTVGYTYLNHFGDDGNGNKIQSENRGLGGGQLKAGLLYDVTSSVSAYANGGYVSKNPIFDFAINDGSGAVIEDPKNEQFLSFEAGLNGHFLKNKMNAKINYYNTSWNNRTRTIRLVNAVTADETFAFVQGINANHSGVEIEVAYQPINALRFDVGASFGNWIHTGDAEGTFEIPGTSADTTVNFYIDGLLVGDAPQNQLMASVTLMPVKGMKVSLNYRYYGKHYSQWDPTSRTSLENGERPQSWQVPDYTVMDFHGSYQLPIKSTDYKVEVFAHVFNLMNTFYIQEAVDNSRYNAFDKDHDADDAEVFVGLPRNYNMGVVVRF